MKSIRFNKEKNGWLKRVRKVSFEDVIKVFNKDKILGRVKNPNKDKYPNQWLMIVEIRSYIYIVPYVETEEEIFLKTIFPSRKYKKKYKKD